MNAWIAGVGVAVALTGGIWAVGKFLPGIITGKIHKGIQWLKTNPWMRAKPHRLALLKAFLVFLEQEIPEPGTGKEFYLRIGTWVSGLFVFLAGTAAKWAAALEKIGDAVDIELDGEIVDIDKPLDPPAVPPAAPPAA